MSGGRLAGIVDSAILILVLALGIVVGVCVAVGEECREARRLWRKR